TRNQKLVNHTKQNPQRSSQTKTDFTPQSRLAARPRIFVQNFRRRFDALKNITRQVVSCEWQQLPDRRFSINLNQPIRELRLTHAHNLIETAVQKLFHILV